MTKNSQNSKRDKASTKSLLDKKPRNSAYFCIRINYNSKILHSELKLWLRENFARVAGQGELGNDTGMQHYQLVVNTQPKRTETCMVKKFIARWPHLGEHLTDGNADGKEWYLRPQLAQGSTRYVMKDESRINGDGEWSMYKRVKEPLILYPPYGWQLEMVKLAEQNPMKRKIYWLWEETGKVGKTDLSKWMCEKMDAIFLQGAKRHVLATAFKAVDFGCKIFIFGVPRSVEDQGLPVSYLALESLKDGLFHSGFGVDATGMVNCNPPHVFVFANERPDVSRMSKDKWEIGYIDKANQKIDWNKPETAFADGFTCE